jgi:hypothetical protein
LSREENTNCFVFDRRNGLADVPKEPDSPGAQPEAAEAAERRGRVPVGSPKWPQSQKIAVLLIKIIDIKPKISYHHRAYDFSRPNQKRRYHCPR